ncbi:MAG: DUF4404 family protein [Acidimicrobiales bacterium]|nr:DUF4404 family protein [Acidimicrobiales bacterium]
MTIGPVPILVAVDLPVDERQLDPLLRLGRQANWRVHLLHAPAPEPDFVGYSGPDQDHERRRYQAELTELGDQLTQTAQLFVETGMETEVHLKAGPVVDTILATAIETNAELIAIVGHKHNVAHRLLLGSVASTILKAAHQPVLVLPASTAEPEHPGVETAVDRLLEVIDRPEPGRSSELGTELLRLREAAAVLRDEPESETQEKRRRSLLDALHRFETEHPTLTRAINDVAYYLSGTGI